LQYRAAALAGIGTQVFWGVIRVMIFTAFYESARQPPPLPFDALISYLWMAQAFILLTFGRVDAEVREMIRTGTIAYEMLRPLDLYILWLSRALAANSAPLSLRAVPIFIIAGAFFGLKPPASWASGAAWGVAMAGALLLSAAFATLINISLLYTVSGEGIARIAPVLTYTLSGLLVPIPLLPTWAQHLLNFLPFRGIMDAPFRLYTGHIPATEAGWVFAHQWIWAFAMILGGRWLLSRALRRLVVQGG
jgi:ABC-2 type transport system permease protein